MDTNVIWAELVTQLTHHQVIGSHGTAMRVMKNYHILTEGTASFRYLPRLKAYSTVQWLVPLRATSAMMIGRRHVTVLAIRIRQIRVLRAETAFLMRGDPPRP